MLKNIFKYLFFGFLWGWFFMVLTMLGFFFIGGSASLEPVMDDFARQAAGAALVGIACGSTAIVYIIGRIPRWMQVTIHFTVGLTGYFAVAVWLKWIPDVSEASPVIFVSIEILVFAFIWSCFYFYNRHEAKKVNARLREMEKTEGKI